MNPPPSNDQRPATSTEFFAYVLPQFHRDTNNDSAWGPGFSDWVTTLSARPLYPGHRQPKIPTALGLYDLSNPETVRQISRFARELGFSSLAIYHYWFSGHRPLALGVDTLLQHSELPVFLCWVNESWKRTWFSSDSSVILEQRYDDADTRGHTGFLADAFLHANYFRVDGKPLFGVYRDADDPELERFLLGLESTHDASLLGFKHAPDDPGPGWAHFVTPFPSSYYVRSLVKPGRLQKLLPIPAKATKESLIRKIAKRVRTSKGPRRLQLALPEVLRDQTAQRRNDSRFCPGILVGWDNTPRNAKAGTVMEGLTPGVVEGWTRASGSSGARLVGVFALNEWAEGSYFEPDAWNDASYPDAIRSGILGGP